MHQDLQNELVEYLAQSGLSADEQFRVLRDIEVAAIELALVRVVGKLPDKAAEEIEQVSRDKMTTFFVKQESINAILVKHLPEASRITIVQQAYQDTIERYLKEMRT